MKVSTVSSRQPSTIPVIEIGPAGEGVGTVEGAQPALAGPERLPARRRGQRLTLCKETTDLLFTGKLSKNSRVPQYTPRGERYSHVRVRAQGAAERTATAAPGPRLSATQQLEGASAALGLRGAWPGCPQLSQVEPKVKTRPECQRGADS